MQSCYSMLCSIFFAVKLATWVCYACACAHWFILAENLSFSSVSFVFSKFHSRKRKENKSWCVPMWSMLQHFTAISRPCLSRCVRSGHSLSKSFTLAPFWAMLDMLEAWNLLEPLMRKHSHTLQIQRLSRLSGPPSRWFASVCEFAFVASYFNCGNLKAEKPATFKWPWRAAHINGVRSEQKSTSIWHEVFQLVCYLYLFLDISR